MILELSNYENCPESFIKGGYSNYDTYKRGLRITRQYQIKEIFWKERAQSRAKEFKTLLFDHIQKDKALLQYSINSHKILFKRNNLEARSRAVIKEEIFNEIKKHCITGQRDEIVTIFDINRPLYAFSEIIWQYELTFRMLACKTLSSADKERLARIYKWYFINQARTRNKFKSITKKVSRKFKMKGLEEEDISANQNTIVRSSEKQGKGKLFENIRKTKDQLFLDQRVILRLQRNVLKSD
jgi:hypothetical protein